MKLHKELVRLLMLDIEENIEYVGDDMYFRSQDQCQYEGYSQDDVIYTVQRLIEAGFINYKDYSDLEEQDYHVSSLTWEGHEFLDNIRDNEIWRKTKEIASGFSSISLKFLGSIASQVISAYITSKLNN